MIYKLETFGMLHIFLMLYSVILFITFTQIPKLLSKKHLNTYTILFGIFLLILKILDSYVVYKYENYGLLSILPLHLCNISLIIGAIFLITKNEILFNILYFFSFGAILAIIFPDYTTFNCWYYPLIYMSTHTFEYVILIYSILYLNVSITQKGYNITKLFMFALILINTFINHKFNTNFMFLNDYAVPFLKFIKPLVLYKILIILTYFIIYRIMYNHAIKKQGEQKI
ncbi:TMEM164-related integral membrane acyltransferase [Caviibacter abscessus]|uniref:TMEM164-related integral membrane acyltransferase n=1 Tax=Caviibacter abscessus TaxID=1766719 RepID=UPI00083198F3|nr:TIGR02206 family membrane protein [Caviibacter abscessus]